MPVAAKKSFDVPDQHVQVCGIVADVVEVGEASVVRSVLDPGVHCPQIALEGKPRCLAHHTGVVLSAACTSNSMTGRYWSFDRTTCSTSRPATTVGSSARTRCS